MADPTAVAEAPVATPSPGPESSPGQAPSTPAASENQPTADATPSGQAAPPSTPKYRFRDQAEAERAHSELQSRYSKLGDPDQAASRLGLMLALQSDPEFREWAQGRLAKQDAGSDDPETQKALQIVEQVADRKARELLAPYAAQAEAVQRAAVYQAMTAKYPDWPEHQTKMAEAFREGVQAGVFSPTPRMTLKFVEALYHMATGTDPEFAAKQHAKRLAQKQATSTQATSGIAPTAVATAATKGFDGAFAAARKAVLG